MTSLPLYNLAFKEKNSSDYGYLKLVKKIIITKMKQNIAFLIN